MTTYEYLQLHDIKPSVQRMAVMDYLFEHRVHPTAEEIFQDLHAVMPTLSRTTVYNTLKVLVAGNAALMLTIDEKNVCYDGDTSDHAHFLCSGCSRVFDLPNVHSESLKEVAESEGYEVNSAHIYYRGLCPKCRKMKSVKQ